MDNKGTKKTAITLFLVTILIFGFGYAMVPLYDVFCKITGLNGKTIRVVENEVKEEYKTDRIVKIRFDSNINGDLPWKLKSNVKTMKVQPGKFQKYEMVQVMELSIQDLSLLPKTLPSLFYHLTHTLLQYK